MSSTAMKMTKARANLIMGHPFFGSLALRLKMVENPKIKSSTCDGVTLEYNPEYIEGLSQGQTQGLIAHSVMHPALMHHTRRGNREVKKWNKACDFSINYILENAGFELPQATFNGQQYAGQTAEHIYTILPDDPGDGDGQQDPNGSGSPPPGGGSGQGQGDGDSDEQEDNDPGGDGGVKDSPNSTNSGASQSQQHAEESEWKMAMAQAAHVAKQSDKLPGDIERLMNEIMEPQLPWRNILRRFMTEKANDDFSWRRGNRRFIGEDLYLPSRESEGSGEMVVVIDTSGSISDKELSEFGSEILGIVNEVRPSKLHVVYCDARIAHIDVFSPDDEIEFKLHGGGGTDFRPPFAWIEETGLEPKCLVYLTDGYGPFPDEEAPFPTLWCINNTQVTPPHGEHLIIDS